MLTSRLPSCAKNLLRLACAIFVINLVEDFWFVVFNWNRGDFLSDFVLLMLTYPAAYRLVRFLCLLYDNPLKGGAIGFSVFAICYKFPALLMLILFPILLMLVALDGPYFNYTTPYFEFLVSEVDGDALLCVWHAENIGEAKNLGVCERRFGSIGSMSGYSDIILYDSSDQILLPNDQRSAKWQKVSEKLGVAFKAGDVISPLVSLGDHYYHVAFENTGG